MEEGRMWEQEQARLGEWGEVPCPRLAHLVLTLPVGLAALGGVDGDLEVVLTSGRQWELGGQVIRDPKETPRGPQGEDPE